MECLSNCALIKCSPLKHFFPAKYTLDNLRKEKGIVSKSVAAKKKEDKNADISAESAASKALDSQIAEQEQRTKDVTAQTESLLNKIGNIVDPRVVIEKNEDFNRVERTWGTPNRDLVINGNELGKLHHHEIMQCLGILEMERGARVAGHRGYYLKGMGVMLNQALINYGLAKLTGAGYIPTQPPFFMKKSIMEATC